MMFDWENIDGKNFISISHWGFVEIPITNIVSMLANGKLRKA